MGQKHLVCGDFNIDLLRSSSASEVLKGTLRLFVLESINSESITRTCRGGGTSIDLCFANHGVTVSIVETAIADHFTVLRYTQIEMRNIDDNENCSYRCWKKLKNEQTLLNMTFVLQHELVKNAEVRFDSSPIFSLINEVLATMLLLGSYEKEMECIIDKLSNKTSEDQNGISNKFLKSVKCTIAPLFTDLINRSIADGIYPKLFENSQSCSYTQVRRQERLF